MLPHRPARTALESTALLVSIEQKTESLAAACDGINLFGFTCVQPCWLPRASACSQDSILLWAHCLLYCMQLALMSGLEDLHAVATNRRSSQHALQCPGSSDACRAAWAATAATP